MFGWLRRNSDRDAQRQLDQKSNVVIAQGNMHATFWVLATLLDELPEASRQRMADKLKKVIASRFSDGPTFETDEHFRQLYRDSASAFCQMYLKWIEAGEQANKGYFYKNSPPA